MREIVLSRGLVTFVDDSDYDYLAQFSWWAEKHTRKARTVFYARRQLPNKTGSEYMHRAIMCAPASMDVDHVDGDGLRNIRSNLRVSTRSQNMFNAYKRTGTSSVYKGVIWDADRSLWRAEIKLNGITYYLGRFGSEKEAAAAYNIAARFSRGSFARVNEL